MTHPIDISLNPVIKFTDVMNGNAVADVQFLLLDVFSCLPAAFTRL